MHFPNIDIPIIAWGYLMGLSFGVILMVIVSAWAILRVIVSAYHTGLSFGDHLLGLVLLVEWVSVNWGG